MRQPLYLQPQGFQKLVRQRLLIGHALEWKREFWILQLFKHHAAQIGEQGILDPVICWDAFRVFLQPLQAPIELQAVGGIVPKVGKEIIKAVFGKLPFHIDKGIGANDRYLFSVWELGKNMLLEERDYVGLTLNDCYRFHIVLLAGVKGEISHAEPKGQNPAAAFLNGSSHGLHLVGLDRHPFHAVFVNGGEVKIHFKIADLRDFPEIRMQNGVSPRKGLKGFVAARNGFPFSNPLGRESDGSSVFVVLIGKGIQPCDAGLNVEAIQKSVLLVVYRVKPHGGGKQKQIGIVVGTFTVPRQLFHHFRRDKPRGVVDISAVCRKDRAVLLHDVFQRLGYAHRGLLHALFLITSIIHLFLANARENRKNY